MVKHKVLYEWKSISCEQCHGVGQSKEECKHKPQHMKQQWVQKNKIVQKDNEGFQKVIGGQVPRVQSPYK